MANRADEYWQLARQCMAMAEGGVAPETRAALIAMATVWARLANEQNEARLPSAGQTPRLVHQQQQQPQPKTDTDKE
jgi:hypothetical protein